MKMFLFHVRHVFRVRLHKNTSPECICGHNKEDTNHYILSCAFYTNQRQQLFDDVTTTIIDFDSLNSQQKLNTLLHGHNLNEHQGIEVAYYLHKYIHHTRRFGDKYRHILHTQIYT